MIQRTNAYVPAFGFGLLVACLVGLIGLAAPTPAAACGGLFCNSSQPVNQAAERILFVDNGDGTTTAVIQIQYQGPSERFAWVLPVPDIQNRDEDISVSSDLALERLQQATNPQYMLTTRVEGNCGVVFGNAAPPATPAAAAMGPLADTAGPAVIVQASGSVGPFDWELLEVEAGDDDAAQVAVDWLTDNMYEIGNLGADLLRPYLDLDNKLLAVRLTKGNESGSIRPLVVRYQGDKPSIPIRPTAVAANPDMGVMVWVGGANRSIAKNYNMLELNEALINWFQPMTNYNALVTAAADEAGGHGFVTEYADRTSNVESVIIRPGEQQAWTDFSSSTFGDALEMYNRANGLFNSWDGFADAFRAAVTIPAEADFDFNDVLGCLPCYLTSSDQTLDEPRAQLDMDEFRLKLFELVVRPMLDTEALLQSQPWVTRMYTTMSAEEMTADPVFDFNPDLMAYSNLHTRERVIECEAGQDQFSSPWRVEFGDGIVVKGTQQGNWPITMATPDMPATLRILQAGTSGPATVMIDNADNIRDVLLGRAPGSSDMDPDTGGTAGRGGARPMSGADDQPAPAQDDEDKPGETATTAPPGSGYSDEPAPAPTVSGPKPASAPGSDGGGICSVSHLRGGPSGAPLSLGILGVVLVARLRRRARGPRP